MGQMVGITHVSIHEAIFDLCLNFMHTSPGNVGFCPPHAFVFRGYVIDRSCVAFSKRGIFYFPFVSFRQIVYLIVNC